MKLSSLLLPCLLSLPWFVQAAAPKPNIIYIISDDLGCFGATKVKTSHLDRLASQGCRFTDAHSTASVCTPTRHGPLEKLRQQGHSRPDAAIAK